MLPLTRNNVNDIFSTWLNTTDRQLSTTQLKTIQNHVASVQESHQTPLFLWLLFKMSCNWRSWWSRDMLSIHTGTGLLPSTTQDAVNNVFDEVERSCNSTLVRHALALVTAARDGLSEDELLDVVSCNDSVLDACFEWWLPPVIRVPPLMLTRMLSALEGFLVARGTNSRGAPLLGWYHRQFWEAAGIRYVNATPTSREETHIALAEYFEGIHVKGKPYEAKGKYGQFKGEPTDSNRQISPQPLELSVRHGDETVTVPNDRRLRERVFHLMGAQKWDQAIDEIVCVENLYVATKLKAGMFYDLLSEVSRMCEEASNHVRVGELQEIQRFLLINHDILKEIPECFFDQAANAPTSTRLSERASQHLLKTRGGFWKSITRDQNFGAELLAMQHHAWVNSCNCNSNGKQIVSGGGDKLVRIWDAASGRAVHVLEGHCDGILACTFSPDDKNVLSASKDKTVRLWNVETGRCVFVLEAHEDHVRGCSFTPNGEQFITCGLDKIIKFWNFRTRDLIFVLQGHSSGVTHCAISGDGKILGSCSLDKTVRVWDVQSKQTIHILEGHTDEVYCCKFSPDLSQIVSASKDKTIRTWDVQSGEKIFVFEGHEDWINTCTFSTDGKFIASGSDDKMIRIWDAQNGKLSKVLEGHTEVVWWCVFTNDGSQLISSSEDKTVRIWDWKCEIDVREEHTKTIWCCEFSPDRKTLATASFDFTVRIWNVLTGKIIHICKGHTSRIFSCSFSPDGKRIVSCAVDKTIRIWNVQSGEQLQVLEGHTDWVFCCKFSMDGQRLVSSSRDKNVLIWDANSGTIIRTFEGHTEQVDSCEFSQDGNFVVSASKDKTARIWDANSGTCIHVLEGAEDVVEWSTISPDGSRVAGGCHDKSVIVWDAQSAQKLHHWKGVHGDEVVTVSFSNDGVFVLSREWRGRLKLFDAENGNVFHPDVLAGQMPESLTTISAHGSVRGAIVFRDGNHQAKNSVVRLGVQPSKNMSVCGDVAVCIVDNRRVHFLHFVS